MLVPVLWRFLITQYIKVLLLCIVVFIAIFFVTILDDIAHFAMMQSNFLSVLLLVYYQVASILPIAIPVAGLIASILLFKQLSNSCELTAMRSCGLSIGQIATPIFITASFLSLANFYIASEIGPKSHLATRQIQNSFLTFNPFVLLKQPKLLKISGFYTNYNDDGLHENGIADLFVALYNDSHKRIHLLTANQVYIQKSLFIGEDINTISSLPSGISDGFDQLILEHQKIARAPTESFSYLVRQKRWTLKPTHLNLSTLLSSMDLIRKNITSCEGKEKQDLRRQLAASYSEIFYRFSISLAPFSLTFLGIAFGINVGRNFKKSGLVVTIFLVLFFLTCFAFGKHVAKFPSISIATYFTPQLLMIACSVWMLRRISRGIE